MTQPCSSRAPRRWEGWAAPLLVALLVAHADVAAVQATSGCLRCHAPIEPIAEGKMNKEILRLGRRYGDPAGCVVCHGGEPAAVDRETAHRGAPSSLADAGGPKGFYARPGDVWVADRTCGQCHEGYADRVRKSVQSTQAETVARHLCAPAWQMRARRESDRKLFGRYAIVDQDGPRPVVGSAAYKKLMASAAERFPGRYPRRLYTAPRGIEHAVAGETGESCEACHGEGDRPGLGPSCSSCHIPHRRDAGYQGEDPTIDRTTPGKLLVHRIQGTGGTRVRLPSDEDRVWSGVTMDNCFQCHFDPRHIEVSVLGSIYAHYAGHQQETGGKLVCQDCHTSIEMHGDGNIAASNDAQREVNCEDCHGTTEQFPWELPLEVIGPQGTEIGASEARGLAMRPADLAGIRYRAKDGYLLTSRGNPFGNVVKDGSKVLLHAALGPVYEVPLLKRRAMENSWRSELGRQVKSLPSAHRSMGCTDCHAEWAPPCYGCHAKAALGGSGASP